MSRLEPSVWNGMMDHLRQSHPSLCRQWFESLVPLQLESGQLRIQAESEIQQQYLQNRCVEQFREAAQAATGKLVSVRFVIPSEIEIPIQTRDEDAPVESDDEDPSSPVSYGGHASAKIGLAEVDVRSAKSGVRTSSSHAEADGRLPAKPVRTRGRLVSSDPLFPEDPHADQVTLDPDQSFDTFVTGPSNRLAHAACLAVANKPGMAYNPLFIHGGVGLGKTHLLHAICQHILNTFGDIQICYLSCETFMSQYIECVQRGLMNQFRNRYRHIDVLVIDDVHFLAKRESSQEEFFHTFNALYQARKQIILSSDSAPSEIPELEERLVSRFQWGLVDQVGRPTFEMRVAIIKSKAKLRGLSLPDDVVDLIATQVDSHVRALEGAITSLQNVAACRQQKIDLELAREAIGQHVGPARKGQVTLQRIIEVVTEFYDVRLADLQSRRKHMSVTEPRQVCMFLARKLTRFSLQEIGGYFGGRDHTTVMHSIRKVEERLTADEGFTWQIEQMEGKLAAPA
ncbi:MAG: chromosomal replication initiator protein DnaA [Phycisphaeraceae bacterium]|nr:chromosomal replication initiator protein DnaA [Phycisphaeraceae bacterium]